MAGSLRVGDTVNITFRTPLKDHDKQQELQSVEGTILALDDFGLRIEIDMEQIRWVPWSLVGYTRVIEEGTESETQARGFGVS